MRGKRPTLVLAGLGPEPARHATLEVLERLGACRVVLNEAGPRARAVLRRFCPGVRVIDRPAGAGAAASVRAALGALGRGGAVGFVAAGFPLAIGPAAARLAAACRRAGAELAVLGAVSEAGVALARARAGLGEDFPGLQAMTAAGLARARSLNAAWPAVVVLGSGPSGGGAARAARSLARFYLPGDPCWVYPRSGRRPPAAATLAEWSRGRRPAADAAFVLVRPGGRRP